MRDVELAILIWGPGEGNEHHAKRQKLRETLNSEFKRAEVRFSEDEELSVIPPTTDLPLPRQELWHLHACHVCVVLDTSKGAGEEIAHFVGSQSAHKLLILTHEKYRDATSFPASLRENQNQLFYTEEEYSSCSLSERVTKHVMDVALDVFHKTYPF